VKLFHDSSIRNHAIHKTGINLPLLWSRVTHVVKASECYPDIKFEPGADFRDGHVYCFTAKPTGDGAVFLNVYFSVHESFIIGLGRKIKQWKNMFDQGTVLREEIH
jgi:hypothetical protein